MGNIRETEVILENCVIVYPSLFKAKKIDPEKDELKFSASFIVTDPNQWNAINAAMMKAQIAAFGSGEGQYKNTIKQVDFDPYKGLYLIGGYANEDYPPQVLYANNQKIMDQQAIFGGCIVNAWIGFWGYNWNNKSKGISCDIKGIQLVNNQDVVRIDGRQDASDVFAPIEGAPAPMGNNPFQGRDQDPNTSNGPAGYQPQSNTGSPAGYQPQSNTGSPAGYQQQTQQQPESQQNQNTSQRQLKDPSKPWLGYV